MLVGEVPFTATTASVILLKHVEAKPKPLREHRPEIPQELEAVVLRALAKQPDGRPQTAAIFADEIWAVLVSTGLIKPVPTNGDGATLAKAPMPINPVNPVAPINNPQKEERKLPRQRLQQHDLRL